jgi:hypothetical protein
MGRRPRTEADLRNERGAQSDKDGDHLKWITGRVVCASAVADWINHREIGCLQVRYEAIRAWCAHNGAATRKQVMMAMIASGVPAAIEYVLDIEWRNVGFADPRPRFLGEYRYPWHDDEQGHEHALRIVVARALMLRSSLVTINTVIARDPPKWTGNIMSAFSRAARVDVAHHLCLGTLPSDWVHAAVAKDPTYFIYLMDTLGGSTPRTAAHLPPRCVWPRDHVDGVIGDSGECDDDDNYYYHRGAGPDDYEAGSWAEAAAARGRWKIFAACDAHSVPFSAEDAFCTAARYWRAPLMDWLWRRGASPSVGPNALASVLHRAAILAVRSHLDAGADQTTCRCVHADDAIKWLCQVPLYRPDNHQLRGLLCCTPLRRHTLSSMFYIIERWPRLVVEQGRDVIRHIFWRCVDADHGGVALARLMLFMRHQCPRARDRRHATTKDDFDPATLDLWDALVVVASCVDVSPDRPVETTLAALRAMRICRAVSLRQRPSVCDVRATAHACGCGAQPDPLEVADQMDDDMGSSDFGTATENDPSILGGLALLARWCKPRAVAAGRLFTSMHAADKYAYGIPLWTATLTEARLSIVSWLESQDLLGR